MVNSPLIRPYFLGEGGIGGAPLGSHDDTVDGSEIPNNHLWCIKHFKTRRK